MTRLKSEYESGGKWQGNRLRLIRKHWFGGVCMKKGCTDTKNLELAHIESTPLTKEKPDGYRSSYERLNDIMKFPDFPSLTNNTHIE